MRTIIREEHARAFERFDVLVSATAPTVAFRLGERTHDPLAMYASDLLDPRQHGRPAGLRSAASPAACRSGCN